MLGKELIEIYMFYRFTSYRVSNVNGISTLCHYPTITTPIIVRNIILETNERILTPSTLSANSVRTFETDLKFKVLNLC